MARRQVGKLHAPGGKKRVGAEQKRVGTFAHKRGEGQIDLLAGAGIEDLELQPYGMSCRLP
jgi:hypothetical protein